MPKTLPYYAVAVILAVIAGAKMDAASLLSNPGFESDAGGQSDSLPGWQTYGVYKYGQTGAIAHGGTNYFKVYQAFTGVINNTGIYQDYISGPGAAYAADGWAYTATGDALAGQNKAWIEVTFRDASANVLALYRSALITTNSIVSGAFPKGQWQDLAVTNQYDPRSIQVTNTVGKLVAPAGTMFVRYQLVFQGDANYSAGSVYFDDLTLAQTGGAPYGNMNVVWDDEFDGTAIKTNIWTYDTGGNGWGNNEQEYYTSRTNNAFVANGQLHIVARQENYNGANYTSARVKSQGLFSCKYGRIEWRAQLPAGTGFWPALWMLGTNISMASVGWPACGEIDVLENTGGNSQMAQGSLHSPGYDPTTIYQFTDGGSVTNFNIYTLDWTTNAILFYVNGHLYQTQTGWTNANPSPFNQPFFLIMNLAIGGNYVGNPDTNAINAGTIFPGEVVVDYARVYNVTDPLRIAIQQAGSKVVLTWNSNVVCRVQAETNSLASGDSGWFQVGSNSSVLQMAPNGSSAFFRLASP